MKKPPIKVNVVRTTETIDLQAWLDAYAAAILEAKGVITPTRTEAA
jgi:hypothetical protein